VEPKDMVKTGCGLTLLVWIDHNTPRADGEINHTSNRVRLCGPRSQIKSNTYTLSGLRRQNKKEGWMSK